MKTAFQQLVVMLALLAALVYAHAIAGSDKAQALSEKHYHAKVGQHFLPKQRVTEDGSLKAVEDSAFWNGKAQEELIDQLSKAPIMNQVRNVIFFLADGTGISTLTAARILKGQRTGNFELEKLVWEGFPYSSLIKTYNTNNIVTDSAPSATAYLTGVKGNQDTIGVDSNVIYNDCDAMNLPEFHTQSVLRDFQEAGRSTGIITNTRVTHASPAGNFAHTANRDWESDHDIDSFGADPDQCSDIAEQLVLNPTGSEIKVILGGGRQKFLPEGVEDPEGETGGRREDGKDLIQTWINDKTCKGETRYVWNRTELLGLDTKNLDYLLGLFDYSHMAYEIDRDDSNPTLEEMTRTAIEILKKDSNGYFLFIEGGLIDLAHHLNEYRSSLEEIIQFEKAVQAAVDLTNEQDTLIVVTADHSQPLTINGYPKRGEDIRGMADVSDVDMLPFTTLLYTNGPGYRIQTNGLRPNPEEEDYMDSHYVGAAAVPEESANHNGEDVFIFARGPYAHLFTGMHENSYIPHAIRYGACVGSGLSSCARDIKR